jgi:CheY-like chemotaxis protein
MNTNKTTVLLIDDDKNANFYNQRIIEKTQLTAEVTSFEDAHKALKYLTQKNGEENYPAPDIIFLDINMPDMDGWSFLEQYINTTAAKNSAPKVFIITSEDSEEDKERAARYKIVSNYICKPLDKNKLKELLTLH